jgi:hypothetical protein
LAFLGANCIGGKAPKDALASGIKEEKTRSTGGSNEELNILNVPSEEENSEYIKGGNTKKIKLI